MSRPEPPDRHAEQAVGSARERRDERARTHLVRLDRLQMVLGPVVAAFFLVAGIVALTSGSAASGFFAVLCLAMVMSAALTTFGAVRRRRQRRVASEPLD